MLVALTKQQERFVINTGIPQTTLKQLRENTLFYCPQCHEKLQLKIGSVKIPHFAHFSKSNCESHFAESESEQHLLGKEQLFQLFLSLNLQVELEPYLSSLQQRPDLLVSVDHQTKFAVEFQCSSLKNERFHERNAGYKKERITPIWIPATPVNKCIESGIFKISLPHHLQQFILSTKNQKYLITYNPYSYQFYYVSNLLYVSGNTYLAKGQSLPVMNQKFPFYLPKLLSRSEFSSYLLAYFSIKEKYLGARVLLNRKGVNDLFLRSIYDLRIGINSLPNFIGVPMRGNEAIRLFSVEWQAALFYFTYQNRLSVTAMSSQAIHYFLKWAKLEETSSAFSAVQNYCHLLKTLSVQHAYSTVSNDQLSNALYSQFLATNDEN